MSEIADAILMPRLFADRVFRLVKCVLLHTTVCEHV